MEIESFYYDDYEDDQVEDEEEEEEINNEDVEIGLGDENDIVQYPGGDGKELFGNDRRGSELKKLTKFEMIRIVSLRALDIYNGARPNLSQYEIDRIGTTNIVNLAIEEYAQGRLPKYIIRKYPDGFFEKWKLNEFVMFPDIKDIKYRRERSSVIYHTDYQIKKLEKLEDDTTVSKVVEKTVGPIELEIEYKLSDELWEKIKKTNKAVILRNQKIKELYDSI